MVVTFQLTGKWSKYKWAQLFLKVEGVRLKWERLMLVVLKVEELMKARIEFVQVVGAEGLTRAVNKCYEDRGRRGLGGDIDDFNKIESVERGGEACNGRNSS